MSFIDSYEKFCKAFNGNPDEVKRAELLLFIQDWIIRIIDQIDEDSSDYSFDALIMDNTDKSHLRYAKKDALSRLIDDSNDASRRISENMRENIIRENVKMPVYKVREVNSYGLNWLSRRPGSTIKEKISSANSSMMAVQRRMSLDTGENRLYIEYLKELSELLQDKLENFPKSQKRDEEESFYSQIFSIIRDPNLDEIRRWENMPPNNTLLSDQNYKKIWRCWNELKQLDELISADNLEISHRICTIFYVEFLTKATRHFVFPQIPVELEYASYTTEMFSDCFVGVDCNGGILEMEIEPSAIQLRYKATTVKVSFEDTTLQLIVNDKTERDTDINAGNIYRFVDLIFTKLGCKKEVVQIRKELINPEKYSSIIIDIFSLRPGYIADNGNVSLLRGRLLNQIHVGEWQDELRKFSIPCDASNAIVMKEGIESSTVALAVNGASGIQMTRLMHLLEQYVIASKFTFLFPDIYNEFQLSLVHKAARLISHEVRSLPRSIGVAFSYMDTRSFEKTFSQEDFLLVLDIVDSDFSVTLIQGLRDDRVAEDIPEYGGVIWERHPSLTFSIENEINREIIDKLLRMGCEKPEELYEMFGFSGFRTEADILTIVTGNKTAFRLNADVYNAIKDVRINVSEKVNDFIFKHKEIIGNSRVHVVSLAEQLFYKGRSSFEYINSNQVLEGSYLYEKLQPQSAASLWRDHLPELAIKLLYGKFNLFDNETITPEFNVEKKIAISNVFTLAKNTSEYHFELVQNDVNRKTRYAAVVKNSAFPINHDVQCRLDMTYQYGAEDPYRLLFIPVDQKAGFAEAKVSWEKVKEYPYMDLDVPDAISSLEWRLMRDFTGRNGKVDLIAELENKLNAIGKGYQTIDVSQFDISFKGEKGKRSFSLQTVYEDEPINIIFVETNVEKTKNGKFMTFDQLGEISFDMREAGGRGKQRYVVNLEECFRSRTIWTNKGHGYASYPYLSIDGASVKVAFFENKFDHPEQFHPGITRVSFEVEQYNNIYRACKIHDEDSEEPYEERKNYFAVNIRKGSVPGQFTYNGWIYFIMLSMFIGKNSFYDTECPAELRDAFEYAKDSWIDMFYSCDDDYVRMRIFNIMSLVAKDIGSDYYEIARTYLSNYRDNGGKFPDYIGYALGDCCDDSQSDLFYQIMELKPEKGVCILSKAIWGNEEYIWNVPIAKTLEYFKAAIRYLKELCADVNPGKKDITMCLEYILGVFRLRSYNDKELNYKLSMNNPLVRDLYDIIEHIIERGIDIYSFLALNVQNKGIYEDIPDLLYAMLVYVSGVKGAGDIKISGLDLNDIDI